MAFVQLYFIVMIFLLGGFWSVEAMSLSASVGENLKITCSHSYAYSNIKYFCKEECKDKDVLIRSNEKNPKGKYSLRDEGNTFYVNISKLSKDDAGLYWCGVERVGLDTYIQVDINVTDSQSNGSVETSSIHQKLLYIGGGSSALLLILGTAVVILIKYRNRDVSRPMAGEESDVTYAKPLKTTQNPSQDTTISCSSANQSSDPDPVTVQHNRDMSLEPTTIYANIQTDSVSYSSVLFSKLPVDTQPTAAVTHSAPEPSVYSEIK